MHAALRVFAVLRMQRHVRLFNEECVRQAVAHAGLFVQRQVQSCIAALAFAKFIKPSRAACEMDHPQESSTRQRHYRHVSWHAKSKVWVVTIKGKYHGSAPGDQEDRAADIAAKALGCRSRDELRIQAKTDAKTDAKHMATDSHYQYVTYSAPRGMWFAQRRGEFLGQFSTEAEAAKAVCKAGWATSIKALRNARKLRAVAKPSTVSEAKTVTADQKEKSIATCKAVIKKDQKAKAVIQKDDKAKSIATEHDRAKGCLTRSRVRDLWLIYRDASGGKGVAALPGDLQDTDTLVLLRHLSALSQ